MSGKQLYEDNIVNELKGSSLFFLPKGTSPIAESPPKEAPNAPVVPLPSPPQAKATLTAAYPLPRVREPLQSPTIPSHRDTPQTPFETPSIPNSSSPITTETTEPSVQERGTMGGPDGRTNDRSTERTKVRHTFDVLADQLFALRELAVERERLFGQKVLLGDLVQEALDLFITKERKQE